MEMDMIKIYVYKISKQQIKGIVLNKENRGFHEFPERKGDVGEHSFVFAVSLISISAIVF